MIPVPVDIGQGGGGFWLRVPKIAMRMPLDNPRVLGGIASEPCTMLLCSSETMVPEGSILKIKNKKKCRLESNTFD